MKCATMLGFVIVLVLGSGPSIIAADPSTESHRDAASELLELMNVERTMMAGASAMVDAMAQQNPQLESYRDVILKWAEGFMNWETFGSKFVALYTESFTEPELRELIAFYNTPTGKKALTLMPELVQRGAALGADVASEHMQELEQMISERAAELEQQSTKP